MMDEVLSLSALGLKVNRLEDMILNVNDRMAVILESFLSQRSGQLAGMRKLLLDEENLCTSVAEELRLCIIGERSQEHEHDTDTEPADSSYAGVSNSFVTQREIPYTLPTAAAEQLPCDEDPLRTEPGQEEDAFRTSASVTETQALVKEEIPVIIQFQSSLLDDFADPLGMATAVITTREPTVTTRGSQRVSEGGATQFDGNTRQSLTRPIQQRKIGETFNARSSSSFVNNRNGRNLNPKQMTSYSPKTVHTNKSGPIKPNNTVMQNSKTKNPLPQRMTRYRNTVSSIVIPNVVDKNGKPKRRYACPYCPKKFHIGKEAKSKCRIRALYPDRLKCNQCGSSFTTVWSLKRHIRGSCQNTPGVRNSGLSMPSASTATDNGYI